MFAPISDAYSVIPPIVGCLVMIIAIGYKVHIIEAIAFCTIITLCQSLISYILSAISGISFKYVSMVPFLIIPLVEHRRLFGLRHTGRESDWIFYIFNKLYWNYISIFAMKIVSVFSFNKNLYYGVFSPSLNIINEHIAIGRLPSSKEVEIIYKTPYNIRSIIHMAKEVSGPIDGYKKWDITYHNFGVMDDTEPKLGDIYESIDIINKFILEKETQSNERVLVNCVMGKGRSAAIVLCWLISIGMSLNEAFSFIKSKRIYVSKRIKQYDVVKAVLSKYTKQ